MNCSIKEVERCLQRRAQFSGRSQPSRASSSFTALCCTHSCDRSRIEITSISRDCGCTCRTSISRDCGCTSREAELTAAAASRQERQTALTAAPATPPKGRPRRRDGEALRRRHTRRGAARARRPRWPQAGRPTGIGAGAHRSLRGPQAVGLGASVSAAAVAALRRSVRPIPLVLLSPPGVGCGFVRHPNRPPTGSRTSTSQSAATK